MVDFLKLNYPSSILLYSFLIGLAFFFFGVIDGLFFQPTHFSKEVLGVSLGREDLYYFSFTLAVFLLCLSCAVAVWIGREKISFLRFFFFTLANAFLFSIWIWAVGWMQISPTMSQGTSIQLDLWRFGPMVVFVNTADFPALIVLSFVLHMGLLYFALRSNLLNLKT
ncbi:MAG: hypothetical protein QW275_01625 [Candidatus Anstonellaceae archaeon]